MGQTSKMGYSLKAIEYLIDIQLKEHLPAEKIYIKMAYDAFAGTNYKNEVSNLLLDYENNNSLINTLKSHFDLCKSIISKWCGFLLVISDDVISKTLVRNTDSYNIYCSLIENQRLFENIHLISGVDEYHKKEYEHKKIITEYENKKKSEQKKMPLNEKMPYISVKNGINFNSFILKEGNSELIGNRVFGHKLNNLKLIVSNYEDSVKNGSCFLTKGEYLVNYVVDIKDFLSGINGVGEDETSSTNNVINKQENTELEQSKSKVHLSTEKGKKIDFIRVINCLYELGFFTDANKNTITKKEVFAAFGSAINKDLSTFHNDLSTTKNAANSDLISTTKIFTTMINKQNELNSKK